MTVVPAAETALLLTPLGRDAAVAAAMLGEVGIAARAVATVADLVKQLSHGAGFVVVTEEALRDADLRDLGAWLAAQPEWSDLPFILLTAQGGSLERNPAAVRHLNTLGNVTFLERPFHPTTLVSLGKAALRARRRQYDARTRLETIRLGEERFRAAVDAVQGVVWTNTAEGEMRGEQVGWGALTGQSFEEYQGYGWASAVHPDDAQPTVDAWRVALSERSTFLFEHRVRVASGEWRIFSVRAVPALEVDGTIREWVGVHTDITHQRATERELAELADSLEERVVVATGELTANQARLRSIFESSFQYFIELNLAGLVLDANVTSLAGIAAKRSDVIGQSFWETPWFATTPGAPELVRDAIDRAARSGTFRQEITINLPAGTRAFDFSIRAVNDEQRRVVALVVEAIDLTDRREAEERLLQSQKLETIGQLTGGVAHDFNNLLTPIVGSLELLRTKVGDDQRANRWATAGLQSAERARVLVDRLLSFARRQALEAVAVDVGDLLRGMRELIGRSIGPTIQVEVIASDDLPPALVDPNQLELSILNLCINARDAMPDGGHLSIRVDVEEDATPFEGAGTGDFIRVSVADTGTGMSPETVAKAIEPFYTTKGIGKGTGLGLSMVHGLAGQLGGGMAIDSILGEGTRISIWLPVARGGVASRDDALGDAFARPTQGARVLLVDDDELVRFAAADMLRDAGYDVVEAASGAEATQLVAAGLDPHVLVTDQLMPGMKGTELASALVKQHPHMAVLIATGYSDMPSVPFPRINKPFASAHLVERVRLLVEANPASA